MIKNTWNWLVLSSANPEKVSLTVKGLLTGIIPLIITLSGLTQIHFTSETLTQVVDLIVNLTNTFLILISSIATAYGIIRKILNTVILKQE